MKYIDWNDASAIGLIALVNSKVLHELGLAICRDPSSGTSIGLIVADDGVFKYGDGVDLSCLTKSKDEIYGEAVSLQKDLEA